MHLQHTAQLFKIYDSVSKEKTIQTEKNQKLLNCNVIIRLWTVPEGIAEAKVSDLLYPKYVWIWVVFCCRQVSFKPKCYALQTLKVDISQVWLFKIDICFVNKTKYCRWWYWYQSLLRTNLNMICCQIRLLLFVLYFSRKAHLESLISLRHY